MKTDSFDFTAAKPRAEVGLLLPAVSSVPENANLDQDHKDWCDIATMSGHVSHAAGDALPGENLALNYTEVEWTY